MLASAAAAAANRSMRSRGAAVAVNGASSVHPEVEAVRLAACRSCGHDIYVLHSVVQKSVNPAAANAALNHG